jgi:hypothetical protein
VRGRANDMHRAAERTDPVAEPDEAAGLRAGMSPADPVVADLGQVLVGRDLQSYPRVGGVRVLDDVGQRLGTEKVQAGLDRGGQPDARYVDLDRNRNPVGEGANGRRQTMLGENRRMQPRGQRAQVLEPAAGVFQCPADQFSRPLRCRVPALLGHLQADQRGDQALLSAVVQVPGDALARDVGRGHQTGPRSH